MQTVRKHWLFYFELAFFLLLLYLQVLLYLHLPFLSPGKAIACLAVAAGVVSLQPDMHWIHKVIWITILTVLAVTEFKSIDLDRVEHEREFTATLDRLEKLVIATQRIERILKGKPLPPPIPINRFPSLAPIALMYFDHTAIILTLSTGPSPFVGGLPTRVAFFFSNHTSGNAVAKDVIADGDVTIYPGDSPNADWENPQFALLKKQWDQKNKSRLAVVDFAKGQGNSFARPTPPLTEQQVELLHSGKNLLYVFGIIGWRDDVGKHETQVCSFLEPPGNRPFWHNCVSGHNTIR